MAGPVEKPTLVADAAPKLDPAAGAAPDVEPPIEPGGGVGAEVLQHPFATMSPDAFLKLEKERQNICPHRSGP